jgi:copper resistance protein D
MSLYMLSVTLHVLAALLWLGGMFFLAAVGAPVLRTVEPAELRAQLFRRLGEQFRLVGWIAIGVLLVTGFANLHFRGMLSGELLTSGAFWATPYGRSLAWKLGAVAGMLVLQAIHDFRHGPAAGRLVPGSAAALKMRRRAALLARVNAVLGIVLVIAAVRLARGG